MQKTLLITSAFLVVSMTSQLSFAGCRMDAMNAAIQDAQQNGFASEPNSVVSGHLNTLHDFSVALTYGDTTIKYAVYTDGNDSQCTLLKVQRVQ